MLTNQTKDTSEKEAPKQGAQTPTISLPKGGGAIRGMGEKFAVNPVTGTGSLSVPLATSPGRSGFGPQLSLSYDSGAGNGPFGLGWNLSLPVITRKTDKGLPRYEDSNESDVFILSGAEDLVPVLVQNDAGEWVREKLPLRQINGLGYHIQRYRPRIEGLFARIERWTNATDAADTFWRSISKDNITTWYGQTAQSRIADPADATRIFTWLICLSHDDKGNALTYVYKEEDAASLDLSQAHERNRTEQTRCSQRYLKRILYGHHSPYFPALNAHGPWPQPAGANEPDGSKNWHFEVVFDYGEHHATDPTPNDAGVWDCRPDPFSSYRAGFEIRTYRLCQRVLMFHHIPDLLPGQKGYDGLVRSTDFTYADENKPTDARNPIFSLLISTTQTGYKHQPAGSYLAKSLPPIEFTYSEATIQDEIREVDPVSLENLPSGLDGNSYQWVDLDGEGLSGILSEQAEGWYYKRNLSPINVIGSNGSAHVEARFGPIELVATKPRAGLAAGQAQFLDLAGDGLPDLVTFRGPAPGFYERARDGKSWTRFTPFASLPVLNWDDSNLKFVDLTGDGRPDLLLTKDDVFSWHPSLAEEGFGDRENSYPSHDEESGPRLVFADGTQSIYLADMSGDGLTDLVRIGNGEICYWPNLGYGRFGTKVTMDNSPWFDFPDQFDQKRIRLADVDGSGLTDILYLHGEGVRIYFNQSGNSWSLPPVVPAFPRIDRQTAVTVVDLLGNGTACLVWSSALPGDARRSMRYLDLMGGQKPHLLVKTTNNLGAETVVSYAPSTKFYLADKLAGKPWVTNLPFPVHCVERVTVTDRWRETEFSTTYSYHHGYFDGVDREFRGFGRLEQLDVESYGRFARGNSASPYITADQTLYQPPVKTITWYHTGALLERDRILSQFAHEYFPRCWEDLPAEAVKLLGNFEENALPEPDLELEGLSTEEWREALRACKGMMLRQETYELGVDALERGEQRPVKLFFTAYHNCQVRRLQPRVAQPPSSCGRTRPGASQHAVFFVAENEAITYHYELDLRQGTVTPDPRIAHTFNLNMDDRGNVLQNVAVVYPRLGRHLDPSLPSGAEALVAQVQGEMHLAYNETRYTNDAVDPDNHRLRVPCEVLTYELTGLSPEDRCDRATPERHRYFTLRELRRFRLSLFHQSSGHAVPEIAYHQLPKRTSPEKRLVEHARMLFFQDEAGTLSDPLPFRHLGHRGLLYETYKLALTEDLLGKVFGEKLDTDARARLSNSAFSGYLSGADLAARFPGLDTTGQYWIRSGTVGFEADAADHFYLPERYTDPFGQLTTLKYDSRDLFLESSTDALGNTTRVTQFDFRVLAPCEMQDLNDNLSEVFFDALGLPTALAVKGKGDQADSLLGLTDALAHPALADLEQFFDQPDLDDAQARLWLGNATARHIYYFGQTEEELPNGRTVIRWGKHPACACGILRETHVADLTSSLLPGENTEGKESLLQAAFQYSDGFGSVVVNKVQAEPEAKDKPRRWVANGKTILNNKGKPVKQYEPYFSPPEVGHRFEELREEGVTPVIYYDAAGRTVRTEMPDGSFIRVAFSPWQVNTYDQNDTIREPGNRWFARHSAATAPAEDQRAAQLTAEHANTPALTLLDSQGRAMISIAHNRIRNHDGELADEKYLTFTKLDAEGKPLWVRDARQNLVMQYITPPAPDDQPADPVAGFAPGYDLAGNLLFQHSMDAGDRWMLTDAAGKPMLAWDSRDHAFRNEYDQLHRPVASFVQGADPQQGKREIQFEKVIYGDTPENGLAEAKKLNLRGQPYRHYDTAGLLTSMGRNPVTDAEEGFDFKGNLLRSTRQLVSDYKTTPDWSQQLELEAETFSSSARYDALNRPIQYVAPHSDQPGTKFNVIRPGYNEANLLERVDAWLEQATEPAVLLHPTTANLPAVTNINYNAKGQRVRIEYGNGVRTDYTYEKETFRLAKLLTLRCRHTQLQALNYTYDPIGNITKIDDDAQQTIFFNGQKVEPSGAFEYDPLYRLIKATGREHSGQNSSPQPDEDDSPRMNQPLPTEATAMRNYKERYEYDPVGNILSMIHTAGPSGSWTRRYDYETTSNRLRATSLPGESPGMFSGNYTYNAHGNMTSMPHLPVMEWDFKDQLLLTQRQIIKNGSSGERTFYIYDASGKRMRKITESSNGRCKMERIYLGDYEIYRQYENEDAETLERETLHISDGKQRLVLVEHRTRGHDPAPEQLIRYQFSNHLCSASLELDEQAQVISYEEYTPYGSTSYQAVRSQTDVPKRYRYTGKERDEESVFCYHGARYYASWLARWISPDPSGMVDGTNLYAYVRDNPFRYTDSTGTRCNPETTTCAPPTTSVDPTTPTAREEAEQRSIPEDHPTEGSEPPSPAATDPSTNPTPEKRFSLRGEDGEIHSFDTQEEVSAFVEADNAAHDPGAWTRFLRWVNGPPIQPQVGDRMGVPGLVTVGAAGVVVTGTAAIVVAALGRAAPYARVAAVASTPFLVKSSDDAEGLSTVASIGSFGISGPVAVGEASSMSAGGSLVPRLISDPRSFREISRAYWSVRGPANGRSLHHWLIPQRASWVPVNIRNAGWNLVELPPMTGVFHRSLGLNQWMGFARNWGPQHAWRAAVVENGIRVGIPATAAGAGYGGYELGSAFIESYEEEE